jgi:ligand-binding SRPBCC domain-containing protein
MTPALQESRSMTHTYAFERRQLIPRPRSEVFPFFADAANLEAITPKFLNFQILTPRPIPLAAGTRIDYRLSLFGVPLRWQSRIEEFDAPRRFVDVQLRGPYKLWHHTHEFEETAAGTLVIDRVRYQIPLGPLGRLAHALFVRRTLQKIFDYRHDTIEQAFTLADLGRSPGQSPALNP